MFSYIQLHSREFHKHFLSSLSHHQTEGMKQEGNVDEYANILHLALYREIFSQKKNGLQMVGMEVISSKGLPCC